MVQGNVTALTFNEILNLFLLFLESKSYSKLTLNNYRRTLKKIDLYMNDLSINNYFEEIGLQYYNKYIHEHALGASRKASILTAILRLNDFYSGNGYIPQHSGKSRIELPYHYEEIVSRYCKYCYACGNKENTVRAKERFLRVFLNNCVLQGIREIQMLNPSYVVQACLQTQNKDSWAVIRSFLKFINFNGIHSSDFSTLVPHFKHPIRIPVTYSVEEIRMLEKSIDRKTNIGKRDYAFILLATRLGMRSGDIVSLTFEELDFQNNTITFIQQKTNELHQLPMLPIIKDALNEYITIARPKSNSKNIFLRHNAPHEPITTSVIRFKTTQYFEKAGIDITNKKHGPHVFRSSLASSMVNNDISYEAIRKILGHVDPDSIKHYAKLNIEKLRECAVAVPEPSSYFNKFLVGGTKYD